MKKIRILQVTGSLNVGGIEKLVASFYEILNRQKYQMDFLIFDGEENILESRIKELGGNVIRISRPKNNYLKYYFGLKKIMKKYGPYDIVHSHVLFNTGLVMRAAFKCNIPIRIAHSHDNLSCYKDVLFRKIYIKIMKKFLHNYSNRFCACSSLAGNYLFGEKFFKKNGKVIYNSIDLEKFRYNEQNRLKIREELNINQNDFIIGNIGRVVRQKNQVYLIDIAKKMPNIKFVIVGDGPLLEELKKQSVYEKVDKQFIFTGTRSDIPALLSSFDAFILPSIHEGLGIVLIEAQSNGLPCIAPLNVVPEEAKILDSFTFTKFPNKDNIDEWCNAINSLAKLERKKIENYNDEKFTRYNYSYLKKLLEELYKV